MKFWVTEEEKRLIDEKMAQLPTKRYGAYLRKMAIRRGQRTFTGIPVIIVINHFPVFQTGL